jgi:hypothetical protein
MQQLWLMEDMQKAVVIKPEERTISQLCSWRVVKNWYGHHSYWIISVILIAL